MNNPLRAQFLVICFLVGVCIGLIIMIHQDREIINLLKTQCETAISQRNALQSQLK